MKNFFANNKSNVVAIFIGLLSMLGMLLLQAILNPVETANGIGLFFNHFFSAFISGLHGTKV